MSNLFSELCEHRELSNHAIVDACSEGLTHKTVQKARLGKKLSHRSKRKLLDALNALSIRGEWGQNFSMADLWQEPAK